MSIRKIPAEMWERVPSETLDKEVIARPSLTYWQDAWRRLKQNKLAMIGLLCVIALIIWGFVGAEVVKWKNQSDYNAKYEALIAEGKDDEASALFVLHPESAIHNGNANLPGIMDLYKINDEKFFYLIPYEFKIIEVIDGQIEDSPLKPLAYRRNKDIIKAALSEEEFAKIEPMLALPEAMQQFKFFKVDDHIIYVPYYFKKDAIAAGGETDKVFEVYLDGKEIEVSKKMFNNKFWFGSDGLGRDIYTRVMYGARISLVVAFVATFVNFVVGVFYGGIAGYTGGTVDNIMMRIVDIISTVPLLIYVILIQVLFEETGLFTICLALGIVFWVRMARLVRGQILSIKEQEYILAARTIGASTGRILSRHLIPNAMGPIIVSLAMSIPSAIFTEAFLSYIGIGIAVPVASWGTMANEATQNLNAYPYQLFYPAIFISATVLAFNFLGDGLRDALDPRLRK